MYSADSRGQTGVISVVSVFSRYTYFLLLSANLLTSDMKVVIACSLLCYGVFLCLHVYVIAPLPSTYERAGCYST